METLRQDLSYGIRTLFRYPGFTSIAVLSLAIGIGANSAIFSVANALLLRPLPYEDADRLVILWSRSPGLNIPQDWFSPGQYLDVKTQNQVFEETAVTIGTSFNLTGNGPPERIDGARVSSSLFPLLGAKPVLGRVLVPEEDSPGQQPTAVLSHGFWQRRFGADPEILDKTLTLNGNPFTIVGVMSPGFAMSKEVMPAVNGIQNVEVLLPLPMSEAARSNRGNEDYNIFARLRPGYTIAQAQTDMDVIAERMKEKYPENYPANGGLTISVVPLLHQVVGDVRYALFILLGAVSVVLLIACGNVANLLLARAAVRQKEIAIRAAVGASRLRLMRQLLTESVLLSLGGGLFGLGIAYGAIEVLRSLGAETIPRLVDVGIDGQVLSFTFLVSLLTGVIFGFAPALRASKVDLNDVLKDGGRSPGSGNAQGKHTHLIRNLLVVAEVALSFVLLIGAGLLIRSYQRITDAHPGFRPDNALSLRLTLPPTRYTTPDAVSSFYKRLEDKVKTLPGIEYVGTNYLLPLSSVALGWEPISVDGFVPKAGEDVIIASSGYINPDYFLAMGIPLIKGRYFTEMDRKGSLEVAIVDDKLAQRFWPDEDPIGKRIRRGKSGPWRTIVGIVADEREYGSDTEPPITAFYPVEQFNIGSRFLVARTNSNAVQLTSAIVSEIQQIDPELPVYDVYTMEERLYNSLSRRRFSMLLLVFFAGLALLLAAIGIYGVLAFWVSQRTHEIGIRLALGAQANAILRMVLRQAALLVLSGIALGLAAALAMTRLMASLLYGVSATDLRTFLLIALMLAGVAFLASYLPARRATKVDPIIALRFE